MLSVCKTSLKKISYTNSRWKWSNALSSQRISVIFSNANGIEKLDICWQKFLTLFNSITRSTCCNVSKVKYNDETIII